MLEVLKSAWEANKIKVILVAIPVILLILAATLLNGYRAYLLETAKKLLAKAQEKNTEILKQENEAKMQAEQAIANTNKAEEAIEEIKKDDDAYWYKKENK
jgi:uncharacterized protein (DUF697 family)